LPEPKLARKKHKSEEIEAVLKELEALACTKQDEKREEDD